MPVNLKLLDGTGRKPMGLQLEVLNWLEANWDKADVLAIQAPTGVGKSFIARTIQRATEARIVAPSNLLIDQYSATYAGVNVLKGQSHYSCTELEGFSCADKKAMGQKPCEQCPYRACRRAALSKPTFFNPMSLFYLQRDKDYERAEVLVVDEAHSVLDMLLLLSGKGFKVSKYGRPKTLDQIDTVEWLQRQSRILADLARELGKSDMKKFVAVQRELDAIQIVLDGLDEDLENYQVYEERNQKGEEYIWVKPVTPPPGLIRRVLDADKVILLSATLLKPDAATLASGRSLGYLDAPSPIPAKQRPVVYAPAPVPMNYKTDPQDVANHILKLVSRHPGENVIIHATYGLAKKIGPLLKSLPLITHTQEDKDVKLEEFKRRGGVFLASGCAEGIDLPGDVCRVNIVPVLHRLNPMDPVVKKRLALPGGQAWYSLETLKTVIQQAGRSTRGLDDRSVTYVCDSQFPGTFLKQKQEMPISFTEAIVWNLPKEVK